MIRVLVFFVRILHGNKNLDVQNHNREHVCAGPRMWANVGGSQYMTGCVCFFCCVAFVQQTELLFLSFVLSIYLH